MAKRTSYKTTSIAKAKAAVSESRAAKKKISKGVPRKVKRAKPQS